MKGRIRANLWIPERDVDKCTEREVGQWGGGWMDGWTGKPMEKWMDVYMGQ